MKTYDTPRIQQEGRNVQVKKENGGRETEPRKGEGCISEKKKASFFAKATKDGPLPDQSNPNYKGLSKCWVWTAHKDRVGYGTVKLKNRHTMAHRLSWMIHCGEIPVGLLVLHRCDNRACVNPDHLWLGTHQDNADDKVAKGRCNPQFGEDNFSSRLTEENVREIRLRYAAGGISQYILAKEFGVYQGNISSIINGKKWKHSYRQ